MIEVQDFMFANYTEMCLLAVDIVQRYEEVMY